MATTLAPWRANSSVPASPMPEVPPVIRMTRSFETHGSAGSYPLNPDRSRRTCPLRRNWTALSISGHDIVLRPVAEHVAGLGRVDAEILAHRVDQVERLQAQLPGRVGRRLDVVERIVHGDHEGLALDPFAAAGPADRPARSLPRRRCGAASAGRRDDAGPPRRRRRWRSGPVARRSSARARRARRTASPATVRCVRMSSSALDPRHAQDDRGHALLVEVLPGHRLLHDLRERVIARVGDQRHVLADRHRLAVEVDAVDRVAAGQDEPLGALRRAIASSRLNVPWTLDLDERPRGLPCRWPGGSRRRCGPPGPPWPRRRPRRRGPPPRRALRPAGGGRRRSRDSLRPAAPRTAARRACRWPR